MEKYNYSNISNPKELNGKVALITGASRGIGRAIALTFAREGADIIVNYRTNHQAAQKVVKEIKDLGRKALPIQSDVSVKYEVKHMVDQALNEFGKIDILVNNAGVVTVRPAEEMTEEEWNKDIDVNLKGVFLCSQVVGKIMIKQRNGNIINIASMVAEVALPGHVAYCAAKAGVIMLTKVLAIEWAKYNIRVNAIAPGFIKTELVEDLIKKGLRNNKEMEAIEKRTPMKRWGTPQDVSDVALFLASEKSKFITGETIFVDGGWTSYGYI